MSIVDDIKARLDIVDVVSGYATLQKAGRNMKALCPFHQERTPSFVIFPDTQTWRCFGACGEGGDVFSFVMKSEGWDFSEALRELAKRAGVDLGAYAPQQNPHDSEESDRLRDLLQHAAEFYHDQLLNAPSAQIARDYVNKRYLDEQTVATFLLGYAPNDWRQALQHLQMHGFTQDEIVEAGIANRSEEKHSVYDMFRHRLMIPIRDSRGQIVGFGARALDKAEKAKYINSPQTALFDKSRLLFGLDLARRAIRETETVVVVEGYMDVMQAHQAGFTNVVAQMGTALTETQLRMLDKYASRLILALDPDQAGISATMRGLNVARQTLEEETAVSFDPRGMMRYTGTLDMDLRVVRLPDGLDPDDFIRSDPDGWEMLIASAVPVAEYVVRQGTAHLTHQSSYQERETVARELLPILTATESDLQRNGNIQALARRVKIDERTLIQWTQRRQSANLRPVPTIKDQRKMADVRSQVSAPGLLPGQSLHGEPFCLQMLLHQPERLYAANRKLRELHGRDEQLSKVLGSLGADDFSRTDYQTIFKVLEQSLYQDEIDTHDYLQTWLAPELLAEITELQMDHWDRFQQKSGKMWGTELRDILREQKRRKALPEPDTSLFIQEVLTLRHNRLERESHELYFLQEDARSAGDPQAEHFYEAAVQTTLRAQGLIAVALQQMKSFAHHS